MPWLFYLLTSNSDSVCFLITFGHHTTTGRLLQLRRGTFKKGHSVFLKGRTSLSTSLPQARSNTKLNQEESSPENTWKGTGSNNIWIKWIIHHSNFHNNTAENKISSLRFNISYNYWYKKVQFFNMAFLILGWVGNAKGLVSYVNYLLWKGCRCLSKCHVEQNRVLCVQCGASVEWGGRV